MSIIAALRTYLATYTGLKTGAPLWVDYLGEISPAYAIMPTPGGKIIEQYINGGSLREYTFSFQSMEQTADDLARIDTNGFFEALGDWMEAQTAAGTLPTLGAKQTAESIETMNQGFILDQGGSGTATYQVQCRLTYYQQP